MSTRRSTLLRWTEDAEAEQMRAMAMFERDPREVAACPLAVGGYPASARSGAAALFRLVNRLGGRGWQIARDDRR